MDKQYKHQNIESKWYDLWEKNGYFTPKIDKSKKPFSILLPLPNANDPMHMGHALFTVQDIMIRYHRMLGEPSLWLPGADHAGYETQFVFEKKLAKEGKSRFDYDRETMFQKIWDYVEENREVNKKQLKSLGFSLDWTRYHYSLEPGIVEKIFAAFRKLHKDGLVYRGERLVNFCTRCGTAFSDLEIKYVERKDPLFYIKYGPFILATTRPETKFGDTAVAYHPGDKRYEKYLGQEIEIQGVNGSFKVKVIADKEIDPKFGTGIEKVTPAHDFMDFEIGKRHNLPIKKVIDTFGRLTDAAGRFAGMKVNAARQAVFQEMEKMGLIDHVDNEYTHNVAACYRCGTLIEPMLMPQWYVHTKPLAKPTLDAVRKKLTRIVPKKRFEKMYFDWMENILDWNISRQTVWGPRIPVWYCLECNRDIFINFIKEGNKISGRYNELKNKYHLQEIRSGLQSLTAPKDASYQLESEKCHKCKSKNLIQETDTFDTWFLSGQWPLTTLGFNPEKPEASSDDFKYFYPTSVLDTMWDILFFWVGRMMMFGLYLAGDVPFKVVHIHARVVDKFGKKMAKSRGNVINPLVMVDQYGADALRMALITGVAPASDIAISDEKVRGMRNFSNKLWNIGRFILMNIDYYRENNKNISDCKPLTSHATIAREEKEMIRKVNRIVKDVTKKIDTYYFGQAAEILYAFIWHDFADKYIEQSKEKLKKLDTTTLVVLQESFQTCLKLLHPFMPFITEEIAKQLGNTKPLIISEWPK